MVPQSGFQQESDPNGCLDSLEEHAWDLIEIGLEFLGDDRFDSLAAKLHMADVFVRGAHFDSSQSRRHRTLLRLVEQEFSRLIDDLHWSLSHTHVLRLVSSKEHDTADLHQLDRVYRRLVRVTPHLDETKGSQMLQTTREYVRRHQVRSLAAAAVLEFWNDYERFRS